MPSRIKREPRSVMLRFRPGDRELALKIIAEGWATNLTGAVRYALKFTTEHMNGSAK